MYGVPIGGQEDGRSGLRPEPQPSPLDLHRGQAAKRHGQQVGKGSRSLRPQGVVAGLGVVVEQLEGVKSLLAVGGSRGSVPDLMLRNGQGSPVTSFPSTKAKRRPNASLSNVTRSNSDGMANFRVTGSPACFSGCPT